MLAGAAQCLLPSAGAAGPSSFGIGPGPNGPIAYSTVGQYRDGAWLVPTLRGLRSPAEWDAAMAQWQAAQAVMGREAPPRIDWTRDGVLVLSLGTQQAGATLAINGVTRDRATTVLDAHVGTVEGWDPSGETAHPCVMLALAHADLDRILLRLDAVVPGLSPGVIAGGPTSPLDYSSAVSWGKLKALYFR